MTLEEYNKLRNGLDKIADLLIEILSVIKAEQQKSQQPEQPKLERWKPHFNEPYWVISKRTDKIADQMAWSDHPIEIKEWENFQCFQTKKEARQEALRTCARRKLEWLARELNSPSPVYQLCYFIGMDNNVHALERPFYIQTGAILFARKADAEYALSQMTSEELEALR